MMAEVDYPMSINETTLHEWSMIVVPIGGRRYKGKTFGEIAAEARP